MKRSFFLKLVCLVLTVSMVLGISACGKTAGNEATPTPKAEADVTPEPTEDATPSPTPEITMDLEGRVIRRAWWGTEKNPERGVSEAEDALADKYDEMTAKYNFTFEYTKLTYADHHATLSSNA